MALDPQNLVHSLCMYLLIKYITIHLFVMISRKTPDYYIRSILRNGFDFTIVLKFLVFSVLY